MSHSGNIYLIREREFIKANMEIYKFGRTTKSPNQRLGKYPKDSQLIISMEVNDCYEAERNLKTKYSKIFKQRKDIGTEYVEGNVGEMKRIFIVVAGLFDPNQNNDDLYLKFLNESTENSNSHIRTVDLYENFKIWLNKNNSIIPSNREFLNNIKKHKEVKYVKINKVTYYGVSKIRFKELPAVQ